MSSESALHSPVSRDPRLVNGRPQYRFSIANLPAAQLPNPPNPPQPAVQNDVGCDDFIRGISGLVRATIQETQNRAEKDRLQKQRESTERFLRRAKAHPSFPATIEYYMRAREAEDAEISRVDKALEDSSRRQLEKDLRDKFPSSTSADKVPELEIEVNAAKNEISRLMERNQSLESILGGKISKLEATFKDQSNTQARQNREVKERLDHHQSLNTNAETKSTRITTEIQELHQESSAMNIRVEQLWKSQNYCTASVAQNTEKMKEQQEKLDCLKLQDIESIRKDLFKLKAQVMSFENSHVSAGQADQRVPHEALQRLTSRVQTLEAVPNLVPRVDKLDDLFKNLQEIHRMSDDFHFAEKEEIKKELENQAATSNRMSNEIAHLTNQLQDVHQMNPSMQRVANLAVTLDQTRKILDTVKVGLHSLETRYNSLSTETVVKNMVVAMQEMYPNINQLTDQTSRLKKAFEKEVPEVLARIDSMDEKLQSHMSATQGELSPVLARIDSMNETLQMQINAAREELPPVLARIDSVDERLQTHISAIRQDATVRLDELNRLRNDHSCLSQSLAPLWERHKSLGHLSSNEESSKLRANLDSPMDRISQYPPAAELSTLEDLEVLKSKFNDLEQTMGDFKTSINTQLGAKADNDRIRQTVDEERDRLLGQINSISTQTKELAQSLAELKLASTNNGEGDMASVRDTINQLQESMLGKYQLLCKELDEVRIAMQLHTAERSTPVSGQEDPAPSKDRAQTIKQESPVGAVVGPDPESSPALALREPRRKKKRSRASSLANEGVASASPSGSPVPSAPDDTPESRRKKKKKKRRTEEPVIID